jgi:hypothetical protein
MTINNISLELELGTDLDRQRHNKMAQPQEQDILALHHEVEGLCEDIEKRDQNLMSLSRDIMKSVEDDTPRDLRKALKAAHRMAEKTSKIAAKTQELLEQVKEDVKLTTQSIMGDNFDTTADPIAQVSNQKVIDLLRLQESISRGSTHTYTAAQQGIKTAEHLIKEGLTSGESAAAMARSVLDMTIEVAITVTLNSVRRLLSIGMNALQSSLHEGAHSKFTTGKNLMVQADRELGRLERDIKKAALALKEQESKFSEAQEELSACSEVHKSQAIHWSKRADETYSKLLVELYSWNKAEEELKLAEEVEARTQKVRKHLNSVLRSSRGIKNVKETEKKKLIEKKRAEKSVNEGRLELLGPCNCGLIHKCEECNRRFCEKFQKEIRIVEFDKVPPRPPLVPPEK